MIQPGRKGNNPFSAGLLCEKDRSWKAVAQSLKLQRIASTILRVVLGLFME